jgi:hypothetical protein
MLTKITTVHLLRDQFILSLSQPTWQKKTTPNQTLIRVTESVPTATTNQEWIVSSISKTPNQAMTPSKLNSHNPMGLTSQNKAMAKKVSENEANLVLLMNRIMNFGDLYKIWENGKSKKLAQTVSHSGHTTYSSYYCTNHISWLGTYLLTYISSWTSLIFVVII